MLIRALKIAPTDGGFRFGDGQPQTFVEVDWFRDDDYPLTLDTEMDYWRFLESKVYNDGSPLLVLSPRHSFTINYEAD